MIMSGLVGWEFLAFFLKIFLRGGVYMRATSLKMRHGCSTSNNLMEIAQIYVVGTNESGFYPKEVLHDYLKLYPGSIRVNIYPYPVLIPVVSILGEKYVKSAPNEFGTDNLLCLPRE